MLLLEMMPGMKVLHRGGLFNMSLMTLMPLMHLVMMRLLVIPRFLHRKSNDAVNLNAS